VGHIDERSNFVERLMLGLKPEVCDAGVSGTVIGPQASCPDSTPPSVQVLGSSPSRDLSQ
jgi:hypothetical protein